jgi:hypothetical protein
MAQTVGSFKQIPFASSVSAPRLGRLIAVLAVLDISIWSYVAIAVQASPVVQPPAVKVALQLPQP